MFFLEKKMLLSTKQIVKSFWLLDIEKDRKKERKKERQREGKKERKKERKTDCLVFFCLLDIEKSSSCKYSGSCLFYPEQASMNINEMT